MLLTLILLSHTSLPQSGRHKHQPTVPPSPPDPPFPQSDRHKHQPTPYSSSFTPRPSSPSVRPSQTPTNALQFLLHPPDPPLPQSDRHKHQPTPYSSSFTPRPSSPSVRPSQTPTNALQFLLHPPDPPLPQITALDSLYPRVTCHAEKGHPGHRGIYKLIRRLVIIIGNSTHPYSLSTKFNELSLKLLYLSPMGALIL
ncbi:hypothetical protein Pcinc_006794 [Petrolisthes cinctipes]|uniref:Uncharacterized protein n=1 Tax=Petrolisthes cinctipes TaxID=88211 RepID=A0AAE1KY21_PETCI|nr:hypothetical protein Pcinc_006794 [Petrolisthes cinctipes]